MQNSEFEHNLDFIVSSLKTNLNGGGQLRTSSDLFSGEVLHNCSAMVGVRKLHGTNLKESEDTAEYVEFLNDTNEAG